MNSCTALSFAQQRFWILDQLISESSAHTVACAVRVRGPLEKGTLQKSLQDIVARHATLRTTFHLREEEVLQCIPSAGCSLPLPVFDLHAQSAASRDAIGLRLLKDLATLPFDLTQGPLLRTRLVFLKKDEHLLLLTAHRIIFDVPSLNIFLRELSTLYHMRCSASSQALPPLATHYAEVAFQEREQLRGSSLERLLTYWKLQVHNAPLHLALPTDQPYEVAQRYQRARMAVELSTALTMSLRDLSLRLEIPPFSLELAAWLCLLSRIAEQEDLLTAIQVPDYPTHASEHLIGCFTNILLLRVKPLARLSFLTFLQEVHQQVLDARAHRMPFEVLSESLFSQHVPDHRFFFHTMVRWQPIARVLEEGDIHFEVVEVHDGEEQVNLTLCLGEHETGRAVEYNAHLFEPITIRRLLLRWQQFLTRIVAEPESEIGSLPLLLTEEVYQVHRWNQTESALSARGIHQLFEDQVMRTPDAIALVFEEHVVSYQELNQRANQLASLLLKQGAGPETLVGLYVDRSIEMAVAVLGILKAGGGCLPLDPSYPQERLAFMLEDARVALLITQEKWLERLPHRRPTLLCLDRDGQLVAQEEQGGNPPTTVSSMSLAYVIYTSGSTGRPKGIALPHCTLVNLITWQIQQSAHPLGARTLQFASLSFDVAFQECFATWCSGGTLVLIPEMLKKDLLTLAHLLRREHIASIFLPYVALQQLAQILLAEERLPSSLKEVITAGEQLQATSAIRQLFASLHDCVLSNHYGPSESHVVTAYTLEGAAENWPHLPPIGKSIANTRVYILDRRMQAVPLGVSGELYISGAGLARGYLYQPDLTAERFLPDWLSKEPGARMYRTGDIARFLPDGNLEFLGRTDQQVKLRGFRIELGEIEAVLKQHPSLREAVVALHEGVSGEKLLVAYLLPAHASSADSGELRRYLQKRLPDYMLPTVFTMVETFLLTPSGKIDRLALPAPAQPGPDHRHSITAPAQPLEKKLAEIWYDVLGIKQIDIHDSFFGLGGHSLQAMQVVSRVRRIFNIELSLRSFYEKPTIHEQSLAIESLLVAEIEKLTEEEAKDLLQ